MPEHAEPLSPVMSCANSSGELSIEVLHAWLHSMKRKQPRLPEPRRRRRFKPSFREREQQTLRRRRRTSMEAKGAILMHEYPKSDKNRDAVMMLPGSREDSDMEPMSPVRLGTKTENKHEDDQSIEHLGDTRPASPSLSQVSLGDTDCTSERDDRSVMPTERYTSNGGGDSVSYRVIYNLDRHRNVGLIVVVFCTMLALSIVAISLLSPTPSHPELSARPSDSGSIFTLVLNPSEMRVVTHQDPVYAGNVAVAQGWHNGVHEYTLWVNFTDETSTLTTRTPKDTWNCYRVHSLSSSKFIGVPTVPDASVYLGGFQVPTETATVFSQPIRLNVAPSFFIPPEECNLNFIDITDKATKRPPVPGEDGAEHFVPGTKEDMDIVDHQQQQIAGEFATLNRAEYSSMLSSLRYDEINNEIVAASGEQQGSEWIFTSMDPLGDAVHGALLSTCSGLRQTSHFALYQLCERMIICSERYALRPPQGHINHTQECKHARSNRPCRCMNDLAGLVMMAGENQCGLCVHGGNSSACDCWAQARLISLVSQYSPCVKHTYWESTPVTTDMVRPSIVCNKRSECDTVVSSRCTHVAELCYPRVSRHRAVCYGTTLAYVEDNRQLYLTA